MGVKFNRKLRFWQRSDSEAEVMAYAGAGVKLKMEVADGVSGQVDLIEVARGTDPADRTRSSADIFCIDLHKFGITEALSWIDRKQAAVARRNEGPACIVVLGNSEQLSVEELWDISQRVEPAGAIFQSWPKECKSFSDAFNQFGKGLIENY